MNKSSIDYKVKITVIIDGIEKNFCDVDIETRKYIINKIADDFTYRVLPY